LLPPSKNFATTSVKLMVQQVLKKQNITEREVDLNCSEESGCVFLINKGRN
jgi:hypothetical protein